ncbi:MAG: tetratricopeptide repeat protein, partial [Oscillospiraceae bacterium]|nr:tetratricopeptide repeat protein [Oscillospiraceae bacterium]
QALERMETMPQLRQELAITHHNLTALYQTTGEREQAKAHLDRALELFEGCTEGENVHYAAALNSLAGFFYQDGDHAQALATFEKAAEYTRKFFGENVEYAITWQNMSRGYEAMGQREETARCLERAVEGYQRLLGAEHEHTKAAVEELRQIREAGAE